MRPAVIGAVLFACVWACGAQEGKEGEKISSDDAGTAFNVFDYNEDGALSSRELRGAVRELGFPMTKKESIALFRASDKDGDGKLTLKELTSVLKQFGQMEDEEEMEDEDDN